jgi:hypothetical protein
VPIESANSGLSIGTKIVFVRKLSALFAQDSIFFPNTLSILVLSILCTNLCLGRPSKESQNAKPHFHLKCKGDVASKFLNRFSGAEFCTEFDKRINRAPARGARAHFAFQKFPARFLKRVQNAGGQF